MLRKLPSFHYGHFSEITTLFTVLAAVVILILRNSFKVKTHKSTAILKFFSSSASFSHNGEFAPVHRIVKSRGTCSFLRHFLSLREGRRIIPNRSETEAFAKNIQHDDDPYDIRPDLRIMSPASVSSCESDGSWSENVERNSRRTK